MCTAGLNPVEHLAFQGGEGRFGGGVISTDPGAPDAGPDLVAAQNAVNSAEVYCPNPAGPSVLQVGEATVVRGQGVRPQ
jgi:hypothetical protein